MPGIGVGISPFLKPFFGNKKILKATADLMTAAGIPNDSTVYFAATPYATTGALLWRYVNEHFYDLYGRGVANSTYNLIPKMIAIYGYIGGTATAHKLNWVNPQDTDAAFRLVLTGGFTHNGAGCTGNATTGWANTKITPATHLSLNDVHISNTNSSALQNYYEMGCYEAGNYLYKRTSQAGNTDNGCNSNTQASIPLDTKRSIMSRLSATTIKYARNGTVASVASNSGGLANREFPIFAINDAGNISFFSGATHTYDSIGLGLTDNEIAAFDASILALQTKLNRV